MRKIFSFLFAIAALHPFFASADFAQEMNEKLRAFSKPVEREESYKIEVDLSYFDNNPSRANIDFKRWEGEMAQDFVILWATFVSSDGKPSSVSQSFPLSKRIDKDGVSKEIIGNKAVYSIPFEGVLKKAPAVLDEQAYEELRRVVEKRADYLKQGWKHRFKASSKGLERSGTVYEKGKWSRFEDEDGAYTLMFMDEDDEFYHSIYYDSRTNEKTVQKSDKKTVKMKTNYLDSDENLKKYIKREKTERDGVSCQRYSFEDINDQKETCISDEGLIIYFKVGDTIRTASDYVFGIDDSFFQVPP